MDDRVDRGGQPRPSLKVNLLRRMTWRNLAGVPLHSPKRVKAASRLVPPLSNEGYRQGLRRRRETIGVRQPLSVAISTWNRSTR